MDSLLGAKPGNTCEPASVVESSSAVPQIPSDPALSGEKCPPLIQEAVSPRVIW